MRIWMNDGPGAVAWRGRAGGSGVGGWVCPGDAARGAALGRDRRCCSTARQRCRERSSVGGSGGIEGGTSHQARGPRARLEGRQVITERGPPDKRAPLVEGGSGPDPRGPAGSPGASREPPRGPGSGQDARSGSRRADRGNPRWPDAIARGPPGFPTSAVMTSAPEDPAHRPPRPPGTHVFGVLGGIASGKSAAAAALAVRPGRLPPPMRRRTLNARRCPGSSRAGGPSWTRTVVSTELLKPGVRIRTPGRARGWIHPRVREMLSVASRPPSGTACRNSYWLCLS